MITITSSLILRTYPVAPALTIWQRIVKRFGKLYKEPKTKLFHYDFILQVDNSIELTRHDILMLRKGIKVVVTHVNKNIVKAITYNKVEKLYDGSLNGQGVVVAKAKSIYHGE
jgi:hypothetical protein